jgi:hypothetical protein
MSKFSQKKIFLLKLKLIFYNFSIFMKNSLYSSNLLLLKINLGSCFLDWSIAKTLLIFLNFFPKKLKSEKKFFFFGVFFLINNYNILNLKLPPIKN